MEQKVSRLAAEDLKAKALDSQGGVCVCMCWGWGVGAGPNVFIAPMKRPENPNKSKTQTGTKATERGWSLLLRAPRFVCC